jgi:hypothetical protein
MPDLRSTLAHLSEALADAVIASVRATTVPDILALTDGKPAPASRARRHAGRPRGSTAEKTAQTVAATVAYVKDHPRTDGKAARVALGIEKNRWSSCVARAITTKQLRKEGDLRATKYWAV